MNQIPLFPLTKEKGTDQPNDRVSLFSFNVPVYIESKVCSLISHCNRGVCFSDMPFLPHALVSILQNLWEGILT